MLSIVCLMMGCKTIIVKNVSKDVNKVRIHCQISLQYLQILDILCRTSSSWNLSSDACLRNIQS